MGIGPQNHTAKSGCATRPSSTATLRCVGFAIVIVTVDGDRSTKPHSQEWLCYSRGAARFLPDLNFQVDDGSQDQSKSRPSKSERVGHPEGLTQFLNIEVLQWLHPITGISHRKNAKGRATRPAHLLPVYISDQRLLQGWIFLAHAARVRHSFLFARPK